MKTLSEVLASFPQNTLAQYDFSSAVYSGALKPIIGIKCKLHGEFKQYASQLQKENGAKCPKCGAEKRAIARKVTSQTILENLQKIHGSTYIFPELEKNLHAKPGTNAKLKAICASHGEFSATYSNLLKGKGCPTCGALKRGKYTGTYKIAPQQIVANARKLEAAKNFEQRCKEVHGDKYDYSKVIYESARKSVTIICPKHGPFVQVAMKHLNVGQGCPYCSHRISKGEQEVADYIKSLGAEFEQQNKTILAPAELDIWVPSKKLAIEFNGMHWHADDRARRNTARTKYEACSAKGIRLINMFDFEWHESQEAVQATLRAAFGQQTTIGARHLMIDDIYPSAARMFLSKWHVDKFAAASLYLGMFYQNKLVGVASFGKSRFGNGDYELVRYATSAHIPGGLLRCIMHAAKIIGFKKLVSYCDMRYGTGRSYASAGFKFVGLTPPDYWWFKGNVRLKRYQTQKHKLKDHPEFAEFYSKDKTEAEICEAAGWRKLSGVGHSKWELTINA